MDLRAEFWQYTPETGAWKRVFQSSTIPNPREPGKVVGPRHRFSRHGRPHRLQRRAGALRGRRDSRRVHPRACGASIRRGSCGRSTARRSRRSRPTRASFTTRSASSVRSDSGRWRRWHGRLFATASGGLTGDGVLFEIKDPAGPSPQFVQVTPDTIHIYELAVFNDTLYLGSATPITATRSTESPTRLTTPFVLQQIVPEGAGRGPVITSVVSMQVFKGPSLRRGQRVGTGAPSAAEEIRINPDDTWDVVVGAAARCPTGRPRPPSAASETASGTSSPPTCGAPRPTTARCTSARTTRARPSRPSRGSGRRWRPEFGFDVWGTCDGQYWWQVTRNAFGDGAVELRRMDAHRRRLSGCSSEARTTSRAPRSGRATPPLRKRRRRLAVRRREALAIRNGRWFNRRDRVPRAARPARRRSAALRKRAVVGSRRRRRSLPVLRSHVPLLRRGDEAPAEAPGRRLPSGSAPDACVRNGFRNDASRVDRRSVHRDRSHDEDDLHGSQRYARAPVTTTRSSPSAISGATSQPSNVAAAPSHASAAMFDDLHAARLPLSDAARPKHQAAMTKLTRLADDARDQLAQGRAVRLAARPRRGCTRARRLTRRTRRWRRTPLPSSDMENAIFRLQRLASMNVACRRGKPGRSAPESGLQKTGHEVR